MTQWQWQNFRVPAYTIQWTNNLSVDGFSIQFRAALAYPIEIGWLGTELNETGTGKSTAHGQVYRF